MRWSEDSKQRYRERGRGQTWNWVPTVGGFVLRWGWKMNLLVRSWAVKPAICWSDWKFMRFCWIKHHKVCELSDSPKTNLTLEGHACRRRDWWSEQTKLNFTLKMYKHYVEVHFTFGMSCFCRPLLVFLRKKKNQMKSNVRRWHVKLCFNLCEIKLTFSFHNWQRCLRIRRGAVHRSGQRRNPEGGCCCKRQRGILTSSAQRTFLFLSMLDPTRRSLCSSSVFDKCTQREYYLHLGFMSVRLFY